MEQTWQRFNRLQSYQVVRIIRSVRRGEEISIDYGFDFYANPLEARQKRADSQYHFSCRCFACVNNWPTYNELVRLVYAAYSNEVLDNNISCAKQAFDCPSLKLGF